MKRFLVLCLVVAVSVSEGYAASLRNKRQVIPREFQNINIENYLKNERAVRFQLKCIIDDGPCDRIGKYLKVTIPELLVNQCANCDMSQRERAGKLVSHIQQNFPEEWERAVKKFQSAQGGLVKPEDAARLESVLGVKLDPKLVGEVSTTAAPASSTPEAKPEAKPAEVPSTSPVPVSSSTSAAPVVSSSEAPASSSVAPVVSSSSVAPVETSSAVAAAVSEASTTVAAVAPSSTTAAAVSSSTSEATSTAAAAVSSSSAAPAA